MKNASVKNAVAHILPRVTKTTSNSEIVDLINDYCNFAGIKDNLFKLNVAVAIDKAR